MTKTREALGEAYFYYRQMRSDFMAKNVDFEHHINAFVNSARSVRHVLSNEYASLDGFQVWWGRIDTEIFRGFEELRNISLKEGPLKAGNYMMMVDFGPEGLKIEGKSRVESGVIRFDDDKLPVSMEVYINDKNGKRTVEYPIVNDFTVKAINKRGEKVEITKFITESNKYLNNLRSLITEAESKLGGL